MSRTEAIKAYRNARDEADMILVGYILTHPGESLAGLCKDADPENWNALRTRVQRRLQKATSEGDSERLHAPSAAQRSGIRSGKSAIKARPELAAQMVSDPAVREALDRAIPEIQVINQETTALEIEAALRHFVTRVDNIIHGLGPIERADEVKALLDRGRIHFDRIEFARTHGESDMDAGLRVLTGEQS